MEQWFAPGFCKALPIGLDVYAPLKVRKGWIGSEMQMPGVLIQIADWEIGLSKWIVSGKGGPELCNRVFRATNRPSPRRNKFEQGEDRSRAKFIPQTHSRPPFSG